MPFSVNMRPAFTYSVAFKDTKDTVKSSVVINIIPIKLNFPTFL